MLPDPSLIDDYVAQKVQRRERSAKGANGLKQTLRQLLTFLREAQAPEISEAGVSRWLDNPDWADATVVGKLNDAKGWSAWLFRHGHIATDPCFFLDGPRRRRRVPRVGTREDVASLFDHCRSLQERLVVSLMVQEGLRCAEVGGLSWADLDLDRRSMFIRGKGGHERQVPISWATTKLLSAVPRSDVAYVYVPRRAVPPASGHSISEVVQRVRRRARVNLSAHLLRATAATDMLALGGRVRDVQLILGHASLSTTSRYLRASVELMREAIDGRTYDDSE